MAVRIRMAMHGLRNNRILHIVAVNQRQRRNAKPIELLGIYNPHLNPGESTKTIQWSVQRLKYWLNVGATPSKTVTKLLQMGGILPPSPPASAVAPKAPAPSKAVSKAPATPRPKAASRPSA
ncbi:ribosomal protein S16 domain-containing protein [Dichomitus squalens]|uniref:Ribosomal protein S16 domain-containing protein n=2 Tax=Dichomitus squalens TaxID=114155 RepID=A0A4Q9N673_9APHY|nr:ribosomal protein S16 domain-containing protein [Dichomitus squalens]